MEVDDAKDNTAEDPEHSELVLMDSLWETGANNCKDDPVWNEMGPLESRDTDMLMNSLVPSTSISPAVMVVDDEADECRLNPSM